MAASALQLLTILCIVPLQSQALHMHEPNNGEEVSGPFGIDTSKPVPGPWMDDTVKKLVDHKALKRLKRGTGCDAITTKEDCLQSVDGRRQWFSYSKGMQGNFRELFSHSMCAWCCGKNCPNSEHKCEARNYLVALGSASEIQSPTGEYFCEEPWTEEENKYNHNVQFEMTEEEKAWVAQTEFDIAANANERKRRAERDEEIKNLRTSVVTTEERVKDQDKQVVARKAELANLHSHLEAAKEAVQTEKKLIEEFRQQEKDAEKARAKMEAEAEAERRKAEGERAKMEAEAEAERKKAAGERAKMEAEAEAERKKAAGERAKMEAEAEAERKKAADERAEMEAEAEADRKKAAAEHTKMEAQAKAELNKAADERAKMEAQTIADHKKAADDRAKMEAQAAAELKKAAAEQARLEAATEAERIKAEADYARIEAEAEAERVKAEAELAETGSIAETGSVAIVHTALNASMLTLHGPVSGEVLVSTVEQNVQSGAVKRLSRNTGCYSAKTKEQCLSSADARLQYFHYTEDGIHKKRQLFFDSVCAWCCGGNCKNSANKCEARNFLVANGATSGLQTGIGENWCGESRDEENVNPTIQFGTDAQAWWKKKETQLHLAEQNRLREVKRAQLREHLEEQKRLMEVKRVQMQQRLEEQKQLREAKEAQMRQRIEEQKQLREANEAQMRQRLEEQKQLKVAKEAQIHQLLEEQKHLKEANEAQMRKRLDELAAQGEAQKARLRQRLEEQKQMMGAKQEQMHQRLEDMNAKISHVTVTQRDTSTNRDLSSLEARVDQLLVEEIPRAEMAVQAEKTVLQELKHNITAYTERADLLEEEKEGEEPMKDANIPWR